MYLSVGRGRPLLCAVVVGSLAACTAGRDRPSRVISADGASDADADADVGADADGTDTETGTDTGADADGDTDSDTETSGGPDAGADAGPWFDAGPCNGHIGEPVPHETASHCVYDGGPEVGCEHIVWGHNPPTSGRHCPLWEPDDGEHAEVVPRCSWVHNLEHGWVVLLYNCPEPCDADLAILRAALEDAPREAGGSTRVLLTPDPLLDGRFAAVAWDWVWEGDPADPTALGCFMRWHYGRGPEGGGPPDAGMED